MGSRPKTIRALAAIAGAGALAAIAVAVPAQTLAGAETVLDGQMSFVTSHEWAAAQPTATGQRLVDLEVVGGKVYAGYGDYGANTGPITLAAFDPAVGGGFQSAFTSDTEAIYNIRDINGEVVAPSTDPRTAADYAMSGPWHDARPLNATHVFDTTTVTGTDLWMVGSQGYDAVAWRSLDGGATWTEKLRVAPTSGIDGDFARFYFAAALDGQLHVQAVTNKGGPAPTSKVFTAGVWTDGTNLLPTGGLGWRPTPFGTGFVYHAYGHGYFADILYFDGTSATALGLLGFDVEVQDGTVWVLDDLGRVLRSTDLATWEAVVQGPSDGRSLAVDGSTVYVGSASSALWSHTLSETTPIVEDPITDDPIIEDPIIEDPIDDVVNRGRGNGDRPEKSDDRCTPGDLKKGLC